MMTAPPMNDQQLYSTNQGYPISQSQDPAPFGFQHQNTSNLSYPSNSSNNNGSSVWDHSGIMGQQHTNGQSQYYSEDNSGYTQQEPFHWQATSYQHDSWPSPFSPHQPYENYYGGYNPYEYGDSTDRLYGGHRLEPWGMMPPFYPSSPMAYSSFEGASRQQEDRPWHDPPSMPHNGRQPAFHVVKGPKRTKSVSFAPLSDQVTFS